VVVDAAGRIVLANAALEKLLGYATEEVAGREVELLVPERLRDAHRAWREAYTRDPRSRPMGGALDIVGRRRDGSEVALDVTLSPLSADPGTGAGPLTVAVVRDVTARRESERRRRELEDEVQRRRRIESLGVFAGGIAHDFNNLLAVVLANAELALGELPDDAPARESVEQIRSAALDASSLTRQILAYAGGGQYRFRELDLSALVRERLSPLRSTAEGARVELRAPPQLPLVRADPASLEQVLHNLVANALEATAEGAGKVLVETGVRSGDPRSASGGAGEAQVFLRVSDDGPGMDAETLERAFEPFFTTRFIGRGLGLPAVLGICRSQGGEVHLESAPGRGTRVNVLLPVSGYDKELERGSS